MDIDTLVKVTTIVYNATVVALSFGVVVAFIKDRRERALQTRHDFLSCTERYIRIQETIINTASLNDLNLGIYKNRTVIDRGIDVDTFSKELALCGMMFQLMEDVWLTHDLTKNKNQELYSGWNRLFKDWMETEAVSQKWSLLRHHFSKGFIAHVEREYASVAEGQTTAAQGKSSPPSGAPGNLAR